MSLLQKEKLLFLIVRRCGMQFLYLHPAETVHFFALRLLRTNKRQSRERAVFWQRTRLLHNSNRGEKCIARGNKFATAQRWVPAARAN
jgi:hypothetical protein